MIVVAANTRGRTPTRGKSNARPLSSGMEISNICRERGAFTASAICHRVLFVSVERVVRMLPLVDTKSARIKFARAFKAARRLFSGLPRFEPLQKSERCLANRLQLLSFPNAPELHPQLGRRRLECPTKVLKDLTK